MPMFVDTSPPGQCIFCRLIAGEIPAARVFEDAQTIAFMDLGQVTPGHVLVVSDDVSLPVGKLRIRTAGSAGGHNGLKSIIEHLGTDQFPRIKIAVGEKPHPDYDLADWVLGRFGPQDQKTIAAAVKRAADAVESVICEGADRAMNRFN